MTTNVPATDTNVQSTNQPLEQVATTYASNDTTAEATASASTQESANHVRVPAMAYDAKQIITLAKGYESWSAAYTSGELGSVPPTTKRAIEELILQFFGRNAVISNITADNIKALFEHICYGSGATSAASANSKAKDIYEAGLQLFDFFKDKGYITCNPFRSIAAEDFFDNNTEIYDDEEDYEYESEFDSAAMKKFLDACLNSSPRFSAVKAVICIYFLYAYAIPISTILKTTWDDIDEMRKNGLLDNFISRLLDNYRSAQKKWLKEKRIRNVDGYLFVKKTFGAAEGIPCDSGFLSSWLKSNITNRRNMPNLTIRVLCSDEVDLGPLNKMDKDADYPILGRITLDGDYSRGPKVIIYNFTPRWQGANLQNDAQIIARRRVGTQSN